MKRKGNHQDGQKAMLIRANEKMTSRSKLCISSSKFPQGLKLLALFFSIKLVKTTAATANKNPYAQGCLSSVLGDTYEKRICNSDDKFEESEFCRRSSRDFPEIRVHNGNWESSIFYAWILQIMLQEIMEVPISVGFNTSTALEMSFYSPKNTLEYSPVAYPWEGLKNARDCHLKTESCVQVLPEVWNGQAFVLEQLLEDGIIDAVQGDGQIGKISWFLPKFAIVQDPSLASYVGLQGAHNREKLAKTFGRPTSWIEYCTRISPINCSKPDEFAFFYPHNEAEQGMYFVSGAYTGYFEKRTSSCNSLVSHNCTGYIVQSSCEWSSHMDQQLYWNNISLSSDGPLQPNHGYDYSSMIQIWKAANATKSPVIMWWWKPESLVELFQGTNAEFEQIHLPTPTVECSAYRADTAARCSADVWDRRGHPLGACDQEPHSLQKIIASSLNEQSLEQPVGLRSPGYEFILNFQITDLQMNSILRRWISIGEDTYGNDARQAVCEWVTENLEDLLDFIPSEIDIIMDDNLISNGALGFGYAMMIVSWLLASVSLGWIFVNREDPLVRVAQLRFLVLICFGVIVSSSTILALSFQSASGDEKNSFKATMGCRAAPFLYAIGCCITYTSILAKTLRLHKATGVGAAGRNSTLNGNGQSKPTFHFILIRYVIGALLVDLAFILALTFVNPLSYQRVEISRLFDPELGTLVIASIGRCMVEDKQGPRAMAFIGPVLGFHLILILGTGRMLWKVRHQSSRYQESKNLSIILGVILEVVFVGVPILLSVDDNPTAIFLVFTSFILVHDIAIVSILFGPKIKEQREKNTRSKVTRQSDTALLAIFNKVRRSRWDEGLSIIDDLLDESNDLFKTLSMDQIKKIELVQSLLIQGISDTHKKASRIMHIPAAVRRAATIPSRDNPVFQHIAAEFGGVNLDSCAKISVSTHFSSMASIPEFELSSDEFDNTNFYIPPEFLSLSKQSQEKLFKLLSWESLARWDFNIFDILKETNGINPLLLVGWAVLGSPYSQFAMGQACGVEGLAIEDLQGYQFVDNHSLRIPMKRLCSYIRAIEQDYFTENPYHNEIHAADVVQTMHSLIQLTLSDDFEPTNIEVFTILLAAVVHDVNHPGENNAFQTNARTDLALIYNDESVLENRHAAHAFVKMLGEECGGIEPGTLPSRRLSFINHSDASKVNILCNVSRKRLKEIRSNVIDAVLHTDMSKHFASVNSLEALLNSKGAEHLLKENRWLLLMYMMHLADISNPAKPYPMNSIWTDRCLEEFFAQGDREQALGLPISLNCDREKTQRSASQIGFIKFVVKPAYELLGGVFPTVANEIVPILESNQNFWETEQQKEDGEE